MSPAITGGALGTNFVIVQDKAPSSPFEGQIWVDTSSNNSTKQYKNGKWESITPDLSEERNSILQITGDIAELRAGQSMNVDSYDNLLVDAFVDESKISNKSTINVNTGINGSVKIGTSKGTTINLPSTDNNSTSSNVEGLEFIPKKDLSGVRITADTSYLSGISQAVLTDMNGNFLATASISSGETAKLVPSSSLTQGDRYYAGVWNKGNSYSKSTIYNTNLSFPFENNALKVTREFNSIGSDGDPPNTGYGNRINNLEKITDLELQSNGSIESTNKSVDSPSSNIQIYQDAELNNQDIKYEIYEAPTDNLLTTITQSEIGDSINISTTETSYYIKTVFNGDGSKTPVLNEYGVDF